MKAKTTKTVIAESRREERFVPINWGRSELSRFLAVAEQQAHATYASLPEWISAMEAIDAALIEGAPEYFHEIDAARQMSCRLFMRAFGTFRAATRLAISGQLFETVVLVRSVLESSVYAWACGHSEPHRQAWEHRDRGDEERRAARRAFAWDGLKALLRTVDPALCERVNILYDQTIDFGAHPNVEGVMLSSEVKQLADDKFEFSTIFLHGEEAVVLAVLDLLRAMQLSYQLLTLTVGDRLRILGVDEKLWRQNQLVLGLIERLEKTGSG